MCAPAIGVMFAASAGLQIAGGISQASNEAAAGKAEQAYYDQAATASKMQSDAAIKRGELQDTLIQDEASQTAKINARSAAEAAAGQKAAMAANGISGTSAESVGIDTFNKQKMDQAAIAYKANVGSWQAKTGAQYESWADLIQANQYTTAGINAKNAAKARAQATLFNTATQVAGSALTAGYYGGAFGGGGAAAGGSGVKVASGMWGGMA